MGQPLDLSYNPWVFSSDATNESPRIVSSGTVNVLAQKLLSTYFPVPYQYIANTDFTCTIRALTITPSKHAQALRLYLHQANGMSGVNSNELAASSSGVITNQWATYTFNITGSGLSHGDLLVCTIGANFDDRGGTVGGTMHLGAIKFLFPARV